MVAVAVVMEMVVHDGVVVVVVVVAVVVVAVHLQVENGDHCGDDVSVSRSIRE